MARMRQLKIDKSITDRSGSPSLDKYLTEVGKESLITTDEEVRLTKLIKNGDEKALKKMVRANTRFVISVAKQYQGQGLDLPDLIGEGNFGLVKAAVRFDETRGFKFISYAVWWIRQSILQALAENSRIVRLPLNKVGDVNKMLKAYAKLEQEFEREPSNEELLSILDMDPERIKTARMNERKGHVRIDLPYGHDSSDKLSDTMPGGENTDNLAITDGLVAAMEAELSKLPQREADIIRMFWGLGGKPAYTLEEIGDKFDLTRERVRQLKEKAIRRLKSRKSTRILLSHVR